MLTGVPLTSPENEPVAGGGGIVDEPLACSIIPLMAQSLDEEELHPPAEQSMVDADGIAVHTGDLDRRTQRPQAVEPFLRRHRACPVTERQASAKAIAVSPLPRTPSRSGWIRARRSSPDRSL